MRRLDSDDHNAVLRGLGHRLHACLRDRARVTGGKYAATPERLADAYFLGGVREQCCVLIDDHATMLRDEYEPFRGYFATWMAEHPS